VEWYKWVLTNSDHDSYFTVAPMFVLAPVLVLSQGGCLLTPPSPRCATISLGYSSQSWVSWVPNLWCQTLGVSDPEYQVLGAKRYGCHTVFGIELGCPISSLSVFTARSREENSVCPSVCLSLWQTRGLWQNRRKICPDFYTIRKII